MGLSLRHPEPPACHLSRAFGSAPVLARDLNPTLGARAGVWRIGPGDVVLVPGELALLLVHLGGPPLPVWHGDGVATALSLTRGSVLSVPTGLPLRLRSPGRGLVLALAFDEALLRGVPPSASPEPVVRYELRPGLLAAPSALGGLADLLAAELEGNPAAGPAPSAALMRAMIDCAAADARLARRQEMPVAPVDARIRRVIDLIEANLSLDLRLGWLATEAGISPSHLSRAFRKATGVNLVRYVRDRRLEVACRMMDETREPLAEIAYACGFSSQSHMTTAFRLTFGTTPLTYRRRRQHCPDGERMSPPPMVTEPTARGTSCRPSAGGTTADRLPVGIRPPNRTISQRSELGSKTGDLH